MLSLKLPTVKSLNELHNSILEELRVFVITQDIKLNSFDEINLKSELSQTFYQGDTYSSILMEYIKENNKPTVKGVQTLIDLGADINLCTTKSGVCKADSENAILWAMTLNYPEIVKLLAKHGASDLGRMNTHISHLDEKTQQKIRNSYRNLRVNTKTPRVNTRNSYRNLRVNTRKTRRC
jgi:hypothetical protein